MCDISESLTPVV